MAVSADSLFHNNSSCSLCGLLNLVTKLIMKNSKAKEQQEHLSKTIKGLLDAGVSIDKLPEIVSMSIPHTPIVKKFLKESESESWHPNDFLKYVV